MNQRVMRNLLITVLLFLGMDIVLYGQNCSINAGINTTICEKDTILLNGTRSGLLAPGSVSTWSQISGASVVINSPHSLVTKITDFSSGTYKFRLSIKCKDGFFAEDSVTVKVLPLSVANAGRDIIFCPAGQNFLSGSVPRSSETGIWTIVGTNNAGITIVTPGNPASAVTLNPNVSGVTTLRWTITNTNGCVSYDEVLITNSGGVPQVNAGPDQVLGNCFSNATCTNLNASNGGVGFGGQKGIWSFVSGPGLPVISSPLSPATRVCNLMEGTYVFRYTVSGPCVTGFDDVTVIVPAPTQEVTLANANAFLLNTGYCGIVNTVTLNGNAPQYTGETVLWTQISGAPVNISNASSASTTVTGINTLGTYCFNYSITNAVSQCTSNSTVCYTFYNNGTVDAGPDQILPCNVTSTIIPTTVTGTGTLLYKIISGPSGAFTYPVNLRGSNVVSGLVIPGTYRVEVNYSFGNGCSPVSDFVDITVSRTPTGANAGTDQNFACISTATQLAGNNPALTGIGSGKWSQISGPNISTLVTPTNYICSVRGTIAGIYVYRWTITGGNRCPDNFDDIKVIIPDTTVTIANAGTDKIICPNSPLTLQGNSTRADETVQWTSIPGGVSFFPGNQIANPTINGLSGNSTYQFIYTIANSCGSTSRDTLQITTSSTAGPSLADAGPDQCLVSGTTHINLNATVPVSGAGSWSKLSGPAVTITNPALNNSTVTGVSNGTYRFIWTVSSPGCLNSTQDTVLITVSGATTNANAGTDFSSCTDAVALNANSPVVGTGSWSQISGDGDAVINAVADPRTTISNLSTGLYTFRWTIANGACASTYDDVKLTISSPPSAAFAGDNQILCGANAYFTTLSATAPASGTGQWVQVSGPNNANFTNSVLANSAVSNLTNGTYTFRWIVTGGPGCPQSTDDVLINVSLPANAGRDHSLCNLNSTTLSGNTGSNGVWSQVSGPLTQITQTPAGNPNATVSGLQPGSSYTFRYSIPSLYGCPASSDEVVINNGTFTLVPDAGADAAYCNASSFPLSGSQPGGGESGIWSVLSGPAGAAFSPSANNPNATLTNAQPGTYILKWTISNATCSSSDQKRIDNYATPTTSNAGNDQIVCFEKATLRGNTPLKGVGTWTQVGGPVTATIAAINNPVSDVSGLNTVGSYSFVWTITNGPVCSPPSRDTVRLIVSAVSPSIANAGTDKILCNESSVTLNGNTPLSGNGIWSEVGTSSATITAADIPSALVNTLNTGIHQFVWTIANADKSCVTRDTVKVINNVLPNIANAGADDTFCVFNAVSLAANSAVAGTTGTWSFVSGPNTPRLLTPNNPACQLTGLVTGTYKLRWTISSSSCPSSADEVNITIINNADQAIAGANQTLCAQSANLNGNTPGGNNKGVWTQTEGPNTAIFVSDINPATLVTNLIQGTYRFVWKIYNERCFTTDTVTLNINQPAAVYAGNDFSSCSDEPVLLSSAFVDSYDGKGIWSIVSGGGSLSTTAPTAAPNTVTYTPEPAAQGTVILRLSTQDACRIVYDDVAILINESSVPVSAANDRTVTDLNTAVTINVLANDTMYFDDTLDFCSQNAISTRPVHGTATVNADGSVLYIPQNGYAGVDSFQYQICTQHAADSSWSSHCYKEGADSAWVFVTINRRDCIIPNAFSPNGDGVNDAFVIECGKDWKLTVFNSWGIELFRDENYHNDWEGTYNGAPIPDGTYFYTLKYTTETNDSVEKAGFICLHR